MPHGRRGIATGDAAWGRAIRIPPLFGPAALDLGRFRAGRTGESAPDMAFGRKANAPGDVVRNRTGAIEL